MKISKADLRYCQKLHRRYGTSYYHATRFFPKPIREATHVVYAFFRVPDEIVDNPTGNPRQQLKAWIKDWQKAYRTGQSNHPVLRATASIFHTYHIPYKYSTAFLKAMLMDTYKKSYATYAELKKYMYGSAAAVGLIMTHLTGFSNQKALYYAEQLGYAMQMTNFIRDIGEDLRRGRIYIPQKDLKKYHVKTITPSAAMTSLIKYEIAFTKKLYASAEKGIDYLPKKNRQAVRIGLWLYRAILKKIEDNNYDVFTRRAHTSIWEKIAIILHEGRS